MREVTRVAKYRQQATCSKRDEQNNSVSHLGGYIKYERLL